MSSSICPHKCLDCGKEFDEYLKYLIHRRSKCKRGNNKQ